MYKEQSRITKNGITIYDYKNPAVHSFFISLYVRAGSMHEAHSGITHFLEHAAIRNVNCIMGGGLYPMLDRLGIEFNASTFTEMVQFYVSGATENFDIASEILVKVLSPIILSGDEIKTERERIKAEIRESDEKGSLPSFANSIVFADTTLENMITGTVASVGKISGKRLEEYRRSVMTSENIFFYVTGNYSDENLSKLSSLIEKYSIEKGKRNVNLAPVTKNFGRREQRVHIKNDDFTMLRFNFDMDMSLIDMAEADLLYDMLLCGYNSRFFIEMSEKRGLFYDISGSSERYNNIGSFVFFFEVKGGSIYDATRTVIELLREIKSTPPNPDEMMKAGFVTNAYMLYDSPRDLNFTFAYDNHILSSSYSSIEERSAKYAAITPERLREVASLVFRPENLTLAIKGNKKKIDALKLEEIIKKL